MKKFLLFLVLIISVLPMYGQITAANGAKPGRMESKPFNYTGFTTQTRCNAVAWASVNDKQKFGNHPEREIIPFNAPCINCIEDLAKRKEDERYFVDPDNHNKFYLQKASGPLHYKKNGNWVTIDERIHPVGNKQYEAPNQWDPLGFDAVNGLSYIVTPQGKITFNQWKLYGRLNGRDTLLETANWANYTAGDDGLHITNIFKGIDAEMRVRRGGIKTNFFINYCNYNGYNELVITDEFGNAGNTKLEFEDGETGTPHASNLNLFVGNNLSLEVGKAVAYAKKGEEFTTYLNYQLNKNQLGIVVPCTWLNQHLANNGIVVIDPQVSSSNTLGQGSVSGSMLGGSCYSSSCNYNLSVTPPADAVLSDILWTFSYSASGSCYYEDGAQKVKLGSCYSPGGGYWSCGYTNPGQQGSCNANAYSLIGDLGSCLPPPSCTPSPITFELQFFRCNHGPSGCDGSCIGAASPWTMTIVGKTFEFVSSSISIGATTICLGDQLTASTAVEYGVPQYTYNWSYNSSGQPTLSTTAATPVDISTTGTYTLYLTTKDACGTTLTGQKDITVNPIPVVTPSNNGPICAGQTLILSVNTTNGGAYAWAGPNGFTSAVQNPTIANAPALNTGVYSVTVTANGCSSNATTGAIIHSLPTLTFSPSPLAVCYNSTTNLSALGALRYVWSTGDSTVTIRISPPANTTYFVTGTDANNCTNTASTDVTVNPLPVILATPSDSGICTGRSVTICATGGVTYQWNNFQTSACITVSPVNDLTYIVTGTDANGCQSLDSAHVFIVHTLSLTADTSEVKCYGGSDGYIHVIAVTGVPLYNYAWSDGSTLQNRDQLPIGYYAVTVQGYDGCVDSLKVRITQPDTLATTALITQEYCEGKHDGSVQLTVTGGTRPYQYTWSDGATDSADINLPMGYYAVSVTDSNFCTDTMTYYVPRHYPIHNNSSVKNTSCPPAQNGSITQVVTGENPPFTYVWENGDSTESRDSLIPGTYNVLITDTLNCFVKDTFTLVYDYVLGVTATPTDSSLAIGQYVKMNAYVNVDNHVKYRWSPDFLLSCNNCDSTTVRVEESTIYEVYVIDKYGCRDSAYVNITAVDPGHFFIPNAFTPNNDGNNDIFKVFGIQPGFFEYFHTKIFDRSGEKVFESANPAFEWDGNYKGHPVMQGVYVYFIQYKILGADNANEVQGSLTILK